MHLNINDAKQNFKYMSLPLQLYKMGPLQNKVTWYKKKIKPCWMANDVEGQENQRDNTIQKANILSFQVSLTKQKLKDLGRRTLSKKRLLISRKHCYQYLILYFKNLLFSDWPVILLQIHVVMVSPGTHLVKNHESLSITKES